MKKQHLLLLLLLLFVHMIVATTNEIWAKPKGSHRKYIAHKKKGYKPISKKNNRKVVLNGKKPIFTKKLQLQDKIILELIKT